MTTIVIRRLQGFNIAAMYDDLSTLEIKLNKLLESKGERPLEKVPGSPSQVSPMVPVAAH